MTTTPPSSALTPREQNVRQYLHTMTRQVEAVLPATLTSPRLFASVLAAFRGNEKLFDADPDSLREAVVQAAFAGFDADSAGGGNSCNTQD